MSKKINVMVDVEDRVYESVIVPHKRNKTFSRLVASLLRGYIEDVYVRGYADDTLDDLRKASVSARDEIIESMQESLSNLGMYSEALKGNAQEGIDTFENRKKPEAEGTDAPISKELYDMVAAVREQNAAIIELIKTFQEQSAKGYPVMMPWMMPQAFQAMPGAGVSGTGMPGVSGSPIMGADMSEHVQSEVPTNTVYTDSMVEAAKADVGVGSTLKDVAKSIDYSLEVNDIVNTVPEGTVSYSNADSESTKVIHDLLDASSGDDELLDIVPEDTNSDETVVESEVGASPAQVDVPDDLFASLLMGNSFSG